MRPLASLTIVVAGLATSTVAFAQSAQAQVDGGAPARSSAATTPSGVVGASSAGALRDALADPARDAFDEGTREFRAGRFAEARAAFLLAYERSGDRRVLYNVAVCDKESGRYARALGVLRESVSEGGPAVPPEYVQRAAGAIATLSKYVGHLALEPASPSAVVRVDGEVVRERMVPVDPGAHVVTATEDGREPTTMTVRVAAGESLRVPLAIGAPAASVSPAGAATSLGPPPPRTALRVTTDVASDVVSIDGRRVGTSGVETELAPGEHRVDVVRAAGASRTLEIALRVGETRDLRLTLEEKKSGLSPWWLVAGTLVVAGIATTAVAIAAQPTSFEGSRAGTLNPYVVTASRPGGGSALTAAPGDR